jgi:hypothetical protein
VRVQGVGGHRGRRRGDKQDGMLVRVRGVTGHSVLRQGGRAGLPHQRAVRGQHTGQVNEALWGHVDIVQASVLDPARRPCAVFCNGYI